MLSKTIMMGRLVADPELRRTQSGTAVCSFRVAVERDYSKDGEKETDFFDVVAWRASAEFICKYFTKGRMIVLEGRFQNREWTDRDDQKRVTTELVVDNAYFGDSKRDDAAGGAPAGNCIGQFASGYASSAQAGVIPDDYAPDF